MNKRCNSGIFCFLNEMIFYRNRIFTIDKSGGIHLIDFVCQTRSALLFIYDCHKKLTYFETTITSTTIAQFNEAFVVGSAGFVDVTPSIPDVSDKAKLFKNLSL